MRELTALLKKEISPALGVTEVGAIALASARAAAAAEGNIKKIHVEMNGGMYKNAFSCAIPGTKELGCEMAALLGAVCGDWTLGLECLKPVTEADADRVKAMGIDVTTAVDKSKEEIYILAEVETDKGTGKALIEAKHSNITKVWKDGEVIFEAETKAAEAEKPFPFDTVTVADFVDYVKTVPSEEIAFVQDMIDMNCALSAEGAKGAGLSIGATLDAFRAKGVLGDDMISRAQHLTTAAMDARLAGLPFPAMSIVGSGSHGILCSMPVVSYGRSIGADADTIRRAVALSGLITIYSKTLHRQTFCSLRLRTGRRQWCGSWYRPAYGRRRGRSGSGHGPYGSKPDRYDLRRRQHRMCPESLRRGTCGIPFRNACHEWHSNPS